jgi:hypothetical protein
MLWIKSRHPWLMKKCVPLAPSALWGRCSTRLFSGFPLRRKSKRNPRTLSRNGSPAARCHVGDYRRRNPGEPRSWSRGASLGPGKRRRWADTCAAVVRGLGSRHGHEAIVHGFVRRLACIFLLALDLLRLALGKRLCIEKLGRLWNSTTGQVRNMKKKMENGQLALCSQPKGRNAPGRSFLGGFGTPCSC